jgi:hypothetical protein
MGVGLLLAIVLYAMPSILRSQTTSQSHASVSNACNTTFSFCWDDDEVEAHGDRWIPQDSSEKPIDSKVAIRCVRRLRICAEGISLPTFGSRTTLRVDLIPVARWDASQITADGENSTYDPCEKDTFVLNRVEQSVLLISTPGPKAADSVCTNVLGKPRTVVYRLVDDLTEELTRGSQRK